MIYYGDFLPYYYLLIIIIIIFLYLRRQINNNNNNNIIIIYYYLLLLFYSIFFYFIPTIINYNTLLYMSRYGFLTEAHSRREGRSRYLSRKTAFAKHIIIKAWQPLLLLLLMRKTNRNKPGPPQTCYDLHWRTVTFWGS